MGPLGPPRPIGPFEPAPSRLLRSRQAQPAWLKRRASSAKSRAASHSASSGSLAGGEGTKRCGEKRLATSAVGSGVGAVVENLPADGNVKALVRGRRQEVHLDGIAHCRLLQVAEEP